MKKKIVIIGGGFTGTRCARIFEKDDLFEVTLIDKKPYFEFTPSILRTILEPEHEKKIQILHKDYLKKTRIIVDEVIDVSEKWVRTKKNKIDFDYLVIASGSDYSKPIKEPEIISSNRARELAMYHKRLEKADSVLIIGGGLVGVELAAEICTHYKDKEITICHSHDGLIERNHPKARRYVENFLKKHGVKIILEERAKKKEGKRIITEKGRKISADMVFMTVGIKSNYEFLKKNFSKLLNKRNQIEVNEFLQVNDFKNIFAGGDITDIDEEKTAQTAEKHADVIIRNIKNFEHKKTLVKYTKRRWPMLISLGKYDGVFDNGRIAFGGFVPAMMKWFVEWKTMQHKHRK